MKGKIFDLNVCFNFIRNGGTSPTAQVLHEVGEILKTIKGSNLSDGAKKCLEEAEKQNAIDGSKPVDVPKETLEELKTEVEQIIVQREVPVYMDCIRLILDIPLSEEEQETVRVSLTEDVEWESEYHNELQSEIDKFLSRYTGCPASLGDHVYISSDVICINFEERELYCEEDIRKLAHNLNRLIGHYDYIISFVVFYEGS